MTNTPWQPIDTAPKDGTPILLYVCEHWPFPPISNYDDRRIFLGHWCAEGSSWDDNRLEKTGQWAAEGGWFEPAEVSHWMPLPPPPYRQPVADDPNHPLLAMSIDEFARRVGEWTKQKWGYKGMTIRFSNICYQTEIRTVKDLLKFSHTKFKHLPNCGRKTLLAAYETLRELSIVWDINGHYYPDPELLEQKP